MGSIDRTGAADDPNDMPMTRNEKAVKYGRFINATGISLDTSRMLDRDTLTGTNDEPQIKVVEKMFKDKFQVVFK